MDIPGHDKAGKTYNALTNQPKRGLSERKLALAVHVALKEGSLNFGRPEVETQVPVGVVNASSAESQGRSTHALDCRGTSQGNEITPRQFASILDLDGIQKCKSLVKIAIVHPGELGVETNATTIASSTTIRRAVGTVAMPSQSNKEASIMPKVGRPRVLAIRHQGSQVGLNGLEASFRDSNISWRSSQELAVLLE